jgi:hypothetical protein
MGRRGDGAFGESALPSVTGGNAEVVGAGVGLAEQCLGQGNYPRNVQNVERRIKKPTISWSGRSAFALLCAAFCLEQAAGSAGWRLRGWFGRLAGRRNGSLWLSGGGLVAGQLDGDGDWLLRTE